MLDVIVGGLVAATGIWVVAAIAMVAMSRDKASN